MGILPMRRRAILALQFALFLRADPFLKRTPKIPVPLLKHAQDQKYCLHFSQPQYPIPTKNTKQNLNTPTHIPQNTTPPNQSIGCVPMYIGIAHAESSRQPKTHHPIPHSATTSPNRKRRGIHPTPPNPPKPIPTLHKTKNLELKPKN